MRSSGSAEQGFADVAALARPRRDRKDRAADVLYVLVQGIGRAEPPLDGDELTPWVALEADEEETRFQLAETLVDPVGEGVAAPQDPLAAVHRSGGEADVGVDRDDGLAASFGLQVQRLELLAAAERGAAVLVAADRFLLVGQCRTVPDLEQHANAAGDHVAAAAHPARPLVANPDVAPHRLSILGANVGGAVLEAHQVARGVLAA